VGDLQVFQRFLRLCAGRSGQLTNSAALGADAGVDHTTARRWLSILEASYVAFFLPPHHANFNKRVIKTPKLYFHDTGLLCWLLGIRSPADLETHPLRGPIFETFVVGEAWKRYLHAGLRPPLYFWRDHTGHEVDLLVDLGSALLPIEIKAGRSVTRDALAGVERFLALAGAPRGGLLYGGADADERGAVWIRPWSGIT
jgi:predicted AAA+ superfamily ATPase